MRTVSRKASDHRDHLAPGRGGCGAAGHRRRPLLPVHGRWDGQLLSSVVQQRDRAGVGDDAGLHRRCSLAALHQANWDYTSATTGVGASLVRQFINTYLMIDGTPFTDIAGHDTLSFMTEVKGRDKRLQQTIRMGSYKRLNAGVLVPAPPAFTQALTGYMPIKWTVDDAGADVCACNTNDVAINRYAEVLLNYAEAKAELGTITAADWAKTVGALRARAGITGGLAALPTRVDPYLQSTYFPDISNPVILEIRRERGIELVLEGLRFQDLDSLEAW